MKYPIKSIIRQTLGWTFILVGVLGGFIPVFQGWIFIAMGAILLSPYVKAFKKLVAWVYKRYPKLRKPLIRFRKKMGVTPDGEDVPAEGK